MLADVGKCEKILLPENLEYLPEGITHKLCHRVYFLISRGADGVKVFS
jgi:hypothetical protein